MKKPTQSLNFPTMTRRSAMTGMALGGAGMMAAPFGANAKSDDFDWTLDLNKAEDNCLAVIKMQADTSGKDAISGFPGQVWGWVPDEGNYHLLDTYGVGVSHVEFDEKMNGWKFYHRECQLYLDKETGEVAESFLNPVTNKRQEVMHVFNDHVSRFYPLSGGRFSFPWDYEVFGNSITFRISVFRVEENPLTPAEYPLHSEGEVYQTGELWGIMGDLREIMDPEVTSASSTTSWVRVAGWIPFMEMGDRPGQVVFHSHAYKMKEGASQLPPKVLAYLEKNAPEYLVSPTEWTTPGQRVTVFNHSKKIIDERRPNLKEGETPFGWKGD